MIKIISMVIKNTLDKNLDLLYLSKSLDGAKIPKNCVPWVRLRLDPENYDVVFYKSGKFLITGVKSPEKINDTTERVLKILEIAGVHNSLTETEIVNIVCLGTLQFNTTLEKIVFHLNSSDVSYEPEQFPGLIYKNWGATFLIFSTGKVIITGVRNFEKAKILFEKLEKLLKF